MVYIIQNGINNTDSQNIIERQVQIHTPTKIINTSEDTKRIIWENIDPNQKNWKWFIIDKSQIITAAHVVWQINDTVEVILHNWEKIPAQVSKIDSNLDIALLTINTPHTETYTLLPNTTTNDVSLIDNAYYIIKNNKKQNIQLENFKSNKTINHISYTGLLVSKNMVNPWDSGSILLNKQNELFWILIGKDADYSYYTPVNKNTFSQ
jgi:hypothetical protein